MSRRTPIGFVLVLALITLSGSAAGQWYRCPGNVYQASPCDGGKRIDSRPNGAGTRFADPGAKDAPAAGAPGAGAMIDPDVGPTGRVQLRVPPDRVPRPSPR
ncbi:MAG TPA: hypothetical protein VM491_05630 [Burkholderiaceae bacterium]|nr:hypothetical protein [Burkholderiaceae bacterium]